MDFVNQLKSSIDIVNVIGQYVRLRKAGASPRYVGLCPFHTEKTPSFSVHSTHQFYKCFGCGAAGDALKFVMEIERISFYEALKLLAEQHGIPMPKRSEYSDAETRMRAASLEMHALADQSFQAQLAGPGGRKARAYLEQRGVAPALADEFGLGVSDPSGRTLVRLFESHDFSADQMEASGLVMRRPDGSWYDRFRDRLMFPIHNESGKVIGFAGRALDSDNEPKYLNSPETPIYKKSYVLYNLHRAKEGMRRAERAVLVEGYMDVIGVWAAGISEVVAACGTALTLQQVQALKRHAGKIVVNFDPDSAGANAAERSLHLLLEEGIHVRVLALDGGLDPDEYCREHGAGVYRSRLDSAKSYFYWLADRARSRFDMRTGEGRAAAFQLLLPAVQKLADKLERAAVANDLAGYLGVDAGLVLENFRRAAAERREKTVAISKESLRADEKLLLQLLLSSQEACELLIPDLRQLAVLEQFATRRIFRALFAVHEAGERVGFGEVDSRLEEADRELLASAVLGDETHPDSISLEQGRACLRSLATLQWKQQQAALKIRLREAERAGDFSAALQLNEELNRFKRL